MIEGPLFRSLVRLFGSRELLHILILGPGLVQAGRDRMRHIMFKSSQMVALLVSLVTLKLYAFPLHLNLCEEWSQKERTRIKNPEYGAYTVQCGHTISHLL